MNYIKQKTPAGTEVLDENSVPVVSQLTGLQRLEIVKATPNTMDVICQRIAGGETLKANRNVLGNPVWSVSYLDRKRGFAHEDVP